MKPPSDISTVCENHQHTIHFSDP